MASSSDSNGSKYLGTLRIDDNGKQNLNDHVKTERERERERGGGGGGKIPNERGREIGKFFILHERERETERWGGGGGWQIPRTRIRKGERKRE